MRFLYYYLIAYYVLLAGAALALWQAGVLTRVPETWLVLTAAIAILLGILVAMTARPTTRA
jgi:uncharacterized membrane protein HdeD (DUF308 family)